MVARPEGFEPPALCFEDSEPTLRNLLPFNGCSENQALKVRDRMCAAVSGCARLIVRSLQKPLQSRGPPEHQLRTVTSADVQAVSIMRASRRRLEPIAFGIAIPNAE
jgi:hypothetical protein